MQHRSHSDPRNNQQSSPRGRPQRPFRATFIFIHLRTRRSGKTPRIPGWKSHLQETSTTSIPPLRRKKNGSARSQLHNTGSIIEPRQREMSRSLCATDLRGGGEEVGPRPVSLVPHFSTGFHERFPSPLSPFPAIDGRPRSEAWNIVNL